MKAGVKKVGATRTGSRSKNDRAESEFALVDARATPAAKDETGGNRLPEAPPQLPGASRAQDGATLAGHGAQHSKVQESPLAKRMREEMEQGKSRTRKGARAAVTKHSFGPEFDRAHGDVVAIKTQLAAVAAEVRGAVEREVGAQIGELRKQLRGLRDRKKKTLEAAGGDRLQSLRSQLADAEARRDRAREAAIAARSASVGEQQGQPDPNLHTAPVTAPATDTPVNAPQAAAVADQASGEIPRSRGES